MLCKLFFKSFEYLLHLLIKSLPASHTALVFSYTFIAPPQCIIGTLWINCKPRLTFFLYWRPPRVILACSQMQLSIGEGRRIDRSSSATQQPKQLGNHCHVCNFLRCDSICYFNAQNVTLSMSDDGGRWRWFVILYFAVCVHHHLLLHTSLLTNWNPISQSNLAKRQGSVVYKLLYQRERDKTTLSDLIKLPSGLNLSSMQIITSAIGICTGQCKICNKCTELITHSVLCTRGCEFATMLQSYTHIKLIRVGGRIYGTPINFWN